MQCMVPESGGVSPSVSGFFGWGGAQRVRKDKRSAYDERFAGAYV